MAAIFFPQEVQIGSYAFVDQPQVFVACPTVGAGVTGTITTLTISQWLCFGQDNKTITLQASQFLTSPVGIDISATQLSDTATTLTLKVDIALYHNQAAYPTSLFFGSFIETVPKYNVTEAGFNTEVSSVNLIVALNVGTQSLGIAANDTVMAPSTGGWNGPGTIDNGALTWMVSGGPPANLDITTNVGLADLWVGDDFIDPSVSANRRQWINADLSAVELPSNGELSGGAIPVIFLHTTVSGSPGDFLANGGLGPDWQHYWSTSGMPIALPPQTDIPLAFTLGQCTIVTPVAPATVLNMDNVRVTSLATESPCTVAQFTTPPGVSPAIGLRWSDTRGKTYGNPVPQELSNDPISQLQWNRTGYARDRVFELFWSAASKTALNGAFVIVEPWKS